MPFYLVASQEDTDVMINWQAAAIRLFEEPEYSLVLKVRATYLANPMYFLDRNDR